MKGVFAVSVSVYAYIEYKESSAVAQWNVTDCWAHAKRSPLCQADNAFVFVSASIRLSVILTRLQRELKLY